MLSRDGIDKLWMKAKDIYEFAKLVDALAEQEQEPVAWMCADEDMTRKGYSRFSRNCEGDWSIPVYTTPPARKPLTDEQIDKIIASNVTITDKYLLEAVHMAIREVEAAHGIGGEE